MTHLEDCHQKCSKKKIFLLIDDILPNNYAAALMPIETFFEPGFCITIKLLLRRTLVHYNFMRQTNAGI